MEGKTTVRIGDRIAELLKKHGYTQKELAGMVGVTEASMSRYLSNEREPKAEVIANLATALHTTSDYLISGTMDESSFEGIFRLVARGVGIMDKEEKLKLMRLLLDDW